jgi:hypothetical protein
MGCAYFISSGRLLLILVQLGMGLGGPFGGVITDLFVSINIGFRCLQHNVSQAGLACGFPPPDTSIPHSILHYPIQPTLRDVCESYKRQNPLID